MTKPILPIVVVWWDSSSFICLHFYTKYKNLLSLWWVKLEQSIRKNLKPLNTLLVLVMQPYTTYIVAGTIFASVVNCSRTVIIIATIV